jgi:hypothetical protein
MSEDSAWNRLKDKLKRKKAPVKPKEPPSAMLGKGLAKETALTIKRRKAVIDAMTEE